MLSYAPGRASLFRTNMEIGEPSVMPSKVPDRISTWSASCRCVTSRLWPGRRRSRSGWISASVRARRGGQPSTMQPTPPPWLSPNVVTRKTRPKVLVTWGRIASGNPTGSGQRQSSSRACSTTSAQCRVDVQRTGGHLVDREAEPHAQHKLLDQERGLVPNDVGTQQQPGVGVADDLAEPVLVFHGPAVGGGPVGLGSGRCSLRLRP